MLNESDILSRYPERKAVSKRPYGYTQKEGDPSLLVPDPAIILPLDQALDQLDAGTSLREVAEWLNSHTPDHATLSHAGLKNLRLLYRPNFTRKIARPKKRMSHEQRVLRNRRVKLGQEKKRIINAEKRKAKLEEELQALNKTNPVTPDTSLLLELDYGTEEFKTLEQEAEIVFKPNPGPQTAFFAASEQEVLYGGAAGGELKSEFYRLLSSQDVKIKLVNCWKPDEGNQQPSLADRL